MITRPSLPRGYSLDPKSGLVLPHEMRGIGAGVGRGGGVNQGRSSRSRARSTGQSQGGAVASVQAGPTLTRGAGANIPGAGVGWTRVCELDVTQQNQAPLRTELGYVGTIGTITGDWTTPGVGGKGAHFAQTLQNRTAMKFRWASGNVGEDRVAYHGWNLTGYDEIYIRAIMAWGPFQDWASGTHKLFGWAPGAGGGVNFLNVYDASESPPWQYAYTNLANYGTEIRTTSTSLAPTALSTWVEIECIITRNNPTSSANGRGQLFLDGTEIVSWDDNAAAIQFSDTGVDVTTIAFGPYIGGSSGPTLTDNMDIYFATFSVWGK